MNQEKIRKVATQALWQWASEKFRAAYDGEAVDTTIDRDDLKNIVKMTTKEFNKAINFEFETAQECKNCSIIGSETSISVMRGVTCKKCSGKFDFCVKTSVSHELPNLEEESENEDE